MATETQWMRRRSLPHLTSFERIFRLNEQEFMVTDFKDFYKYDVESDEWTYILRNIKKLNVGGLYPVCYDQSTNSLFYQDGSNSQMTRIDMTNGEIIDFERVGFNVQSMIVKDEELHLFGTRRNAQSIRAFCSMG